MRRERVFCVSVVVFCLCLLLSWVGSAEGYTGYYQSISGTDNNRLDSLNSMQQWSGSQWVTGITLPGPTDFLFIGSSDASVFWTLNSSTNPAIARSWRHMGLPYKWHPDSKHDYKTLLLGNRPNTARGLQIDGWLEVEEFRLGYGFVAPQNPQTSMQGTDSTPYTSTVYIHKGAYHGTAWREPDAEVKIGQLRNYNTVSGTNFSFTQYGGNVEIGDIHLNTSQIAYIISGGLLDVTGRFHNITNGVTALGFDGGGYMKMDADDRTDLVNKGAFYVKVGGSWLQLNSSSFNTYLSYSPVEGNRVIIGLASADAWYPQPAHGATGVDVFSDLGWARGQNAIASNVYLGSSDSAVATADRLAGDISGDGPVNVDDVMILADQWLTSPGCVYPTADILGTGTVGLGDFAELASGWLSTPFSEFKAGLNATIYPVGGLAPYTTYYWRVEGVNPCQSAGEGTVWSFTTGSDQPPPAPGDPFPMNGENDASIRTNLYWGASSGTVSEYKVFLGTTNPPAYLGTVTEVYNRIWRIPTDLQHGMRYYWRINPVNALGETTGTVWYFDTSPYRANPSEFAIIPWTEPWRSWPAGQSVTTYEQARDMYKAGFNVAGFLRTGSNLIELNNAEKAGIRGIIYDDLTHVQIGWNRWGAYQAQTNVDQLLAKLSSHPYGYHPSAWQLYLKDEPRLDPPGANSGEGGYLYILEHFQIACRNRGYKGYVNLYPNYASPEQMGYSTYQQYVDAWKGRQPDYICYDHYYGSTVGQNFWDNMDVVRTAARSIGKPFWFIGQAAKGWQGGYPNGSAWDTPTEGTLRFQAYSAMAYGAKSIGWYQYFQWPLGIESTLDFTHAAIDTNGTKTNTWTLLRNVNLELHRVAETYVKWTNQKVYHGTTGNYLSVFSGSGSFVVGEFTDNQGRRCVLITNKNRAGSATVNSVSWHGGGGTLWVNPTTGAVSGFGGATLLAGQGLLLIRN